ncbi:MAG: hypothetical protein Q7T36_07765 [Fluviicoccus sp.]|uniref:hypothetical protein n=1 Tax=Fluviicoccus sp. TaxID=2003552 RepID=UPI002719C002|nr:hypothetical protein [Fluviicoccus sp.]MDO8330349.1 hypothetical protein [Fluviicoccus sp.]
MTRIVGQELHEVSGVSMSLSGKVILRVLVLALSLGAEFAIAATSNAPAGSEPKRWYRFFSEGGIPTLSDQITEEHVKRGYDILDRNMQVLRRIPAFNEDAYQKDKVRRDAMLRRQQEDARILRLYSSSRDAELARNRLLDTLETSIGYNAIQLMRLKRLRSELVEHAADQERSGKSLTNQTKDQIHQYELQIQDLNSLVASQRAEQAKVRQDFIGIIQRLTELESNKGGLPAIAPPPSP